MAGILNVNGAYDINTRKITSKISFEVGQVFLARISHMGENDKEILLKMLDGWQFAASLQKSMEYTPNGLVKFQVMGFEDGKLIIAMAPNKNEKSTNEDSIEDTAKKIDVNIDKDDFKLLKDMIKHNMPITKENLVKIKTFVDFKEKISSNNGEEDNFINNYLKSKEVDKLSPEGRKIEQLLKGFFKELKSVNTEDILTMIENEIDVNDENIKSYNRVFKGDETIHKQIMELKEGVLPKNTEGESLPINVEKQTFPKDTKEGVSPKNIAEQILPKSIEKEVVLKDIKEQTVLNNEEKGVVSKNIDKQSISPKTVSDNELPREEKTQIAGFEKEANIVQDKVRSSSSQENTIRYKLTNLINSTVEDVKTELSSKNQQIKDILEGIINEKSDVKPELYDKVMDTIKSNINDYKIFNSVSNQYYYMDVPINIKDSEYQCKLIIKDERKKGKKIDSKHVKIVASVKTINMGTIDAYLTILNTNMNIELKCTDTWMMVFEAGKEKLQKELGGLGYNIIVHIGKKENEVSLSKCRDFFNDNSIDVVNVLV